MQAHLPIHENLLEMILFEINRIFSEQIYMKTLYQTLFSIGYYGLFHIGELVMPGKHVMKVKDIHVATNKEKILIVLYSSKTHDESSHPQKIKISSNGNSNKFFCPFKLIKGYMKMRGSYDSNQEPFFVFHDGGPVLALHVRAVLKASIRNLGLQTKYYVVHGLRSGRSTDLFKAGYSVDQIKQMGRWKSNAVYKYLRQ